VEHNFFCVISIRTALHTAREETTMIMLWRSVPNVSTTKFTKFDLLSNTLYYSVQ